MKLLLFSVFRSPDNLLTDDSFSLEELLGDWWCLSENDAKLDFGRFVRDFLDAKIDDFNVSFLIFFNFLSSSGESFIMPSIKFNKIFLNDKRAE